MAKRSVQPHPCHKQLSNPHKIKKICCNKSRLSFKGLEVNNSAPSPTETKPTVHRHCEQLICLPKIKLPTLSSDTWDHVIIRCRIQRMHTVQKTKQSTPGSLTLLLKYFWALNARKSWLSGYLKWYHYVGTLKYQTDRTQNWVFKSMSLLLQAATPCNILKTIILHPTVNWAFPFVDSPFTLQGSHWGITSRYQLP